MDPRLTYGAAIERALRVYTEIPSRAGQLETILSIDSSGQRFLVIVQGWQLGRRMHYCLAHVELAGDQVYVHEDRTEDLIVPDLVAAGIPAEAIVATYLQSEPAPALAQP